jgi:ferric-dicitrate binding protein FerR (iron transport regulator)
MISVNDSGQSPSHREGEPDRLASRDAETRALVARLPDASPAPEFLARLRQDFQRGTVQPALRAVPSWKRPVVRWTGAALGLAAALVLVLLANRGPGWQMVRASGAGSLFVGTTEIALSDVAEELTMLRPGTVVRMEGDETASLDLFYPGLLSLQVTPGSRLSLPAAPGRWFGRRSSFRVDEGEVRVVTGPRFSGARLEISAPGTEVHVLGTTFAVIATADSTCLCVLEGTARMMMPQESSMMPVPPMRRRTVFMDSAETMEEPIRPMEEMKLTMLRDTAMPVLERAR